MFEEILTLNQKDKREFEFGMDLGFFNGRLIFEGTYYIKTIEDLILLADFRTVYCFDQQYVNAGEIAK